LGRAFGDTMVPFYRDLLDQGVRNATFRELDLRLLFVSIAGMAEYLSAARSLFPDLPDDELIERFTHHTIDLLLQGIRA